MQHVDIVKHQIMAFFLFHNLNLNHIDLVTKKGLKPAKKPIIYS